ncbi:class I SAM-dependent methyltransferase [Saccharopolyspora elongata]|uniref:class I SAM-dependent methyltransferase n=1 Tax=Saccharopolyspora elongata TaxID=2530387 RepID=UPI001F2B8F49|nr:methyltransferase domain-containing protein [Saccharopolyspora elongata]
MTAPQDPEVIKGCCAAAYGQDAVALLLGDSYHPGGQALSTRLAEALDLRPGQRVADIASGPGATARLLVGRFGVHVDGIELNPTIVGKARETTRVDGLSDSVRFHVGDAEGLPLPDNIFHAVVCECAFCTFPYKHTAAAELARVLQPGGRVGITDVTVHPDGLPSELAGLTAWVACIADARPLEDYAAILAGADLRTTHTQRHDEACEP